MGSFGFVEGKWPFNIAKSGGARGLAMLIGKVAKKSATGGNLPRMDTDGHGCGGGNKEVRK